MMMRMAGTVAVVCSCAASAQAPHKQPVVPGGMEWAPDGLHFSPAVRSGELLFVSGVTAGVPAGASDSQKEAALDQAFREIAKTLAHSGASWDDVLQITSYHTDFTGGAAPMDQQQLFRKVKDRFVRAPYPAWTAVGVTRLWNDSHFAEISVIARVPSR